MPSPPSLPDTAVCRACGYSLRGLPGNVCPECGGPFVPADPATWRDKARLGRAERLWYVLAAAPSAFSVRLIVVLTFIHFWAVSNPDWYFDSREIYPMLALAGMAPMVVAYLIKAASRLSQYLAMALGYPVRSTRGRPAGRLALPLCMGLIGSSFLAPDWPFEARIALSRPFLVRKARQVRSAGISDNRSQLVGLMWVQRVGLLSDGQVKFQVHSGRGLMYDPDRRRPNAFFVGTYRPRICELSAMEWYWMAW